MLLKQSVMITFLSCFKGVIIIYSNYYDLNLYLQQLGQFIEYQNSRLTELELMIQQLQKELAEVKNRPATTIEKIEYKFDQLKVETLEGTLNIGLNPTNGETIEDFAVKQDKMNVKATSGTEQQVVNDINNEINRYLDQECPEFIRSMEEQNNYHLDESYRTFIIDDIRKQINDRIHYYLQQNQEQIDRSDTTEELQDIITNKVKSDIQSSIQAFMTNMPDNMKGG